MTPVRARASLRRPGHPGPVSCPLVCHPPSRPARPPCPGTVSVRESWTFTDLTSPLRHAVETFPQKGTCLVGGEFSVDQSLNSGKRRAEFSGCL